MKRTLLVGWVLGAALVAVTGCAHVGPPAIVTDRIQYSTAMATSWKQQTLLNIVRVRYVDVPEFVDVSSILGGYSLDQTEAANVTQNILKVNSVLPPLMSVGLTGNRTRTDRPTVTYSPQTGAEFTRNLITPITPVAILQQLETGAPGDVILNVAVESINGIRNSQFFAGKAEPADPRFEKVVELMMKAQSEGLISLRVAPNRDGAGTTALFAIHDELSASGAAGTAELRRLLGLDPKLHDFHIVFGLHPRGPDEIAIRTRSVIRILTYLSLTVEVPPEHIKDGRAPDLGKSPVGPHPQFTAHCGSKQPADCYCAVPYEGHWFWIDHADYRAKRTFLNLKILLALANTAPKDTSPILSINAN